MFISIGADCLCLISNDIFISCNGYYEIQLERYLITVFQENNFSKPRNVQCRIYMKSSKLTEYVQLDWITKSLSGRHKHTLYPYWVPLEIGVFYFLVAFLVEVTLYSSLVVNWSVLYFTIELNWLEQCCIHSISCFWMLDYCRKTPKWCKRLNMVKR